LIDGRITIVAAPTNIHVQRLNDGELTKTLAVRHEMPRFPSLLHTADPAASLT
jgi:hypothetical protein